MTPKQAELEARLLIWEERLAKATLRLGILFSFVQVVATLHWDQTLVDGRLRVARIVMAVISAGCGVFLLIASKWLPRSARASAGMCVILAILTLYAAEIYLGRERVTPGTAAVRAGRAWDNRNHLDVIRDLAREGKPAVPLVTPAIVSKLNLRGLVVDGIEMLPLGGISNRWTSFGNETGKFIVYESDEHGFNNPKGSWSLRELAGTTEPAAGSLNVSRAARPVPALKPLDLAMTGDSFTQGDYVAPEDNIGALLRRRYPALLNLGMSANGPLTELGAIKEYLPALRPKVVLWMFYENDIPDLDREAKVPALLRYLDKDYTQGLLNHQASIDRELERLIRSEEEKSSQWPKTWPTGLAALGLTRQRTPFWLQDIVMGETQSPAVRIARLDTVRNSLTASWVYSVKAESQMSLLVRTLESARDTVRSWGGKLEFVFLPGYELMRSTKPEALRFRDQIFSTVRPLGIPIIDLYPKLRSKPRPLALFAYPYSHYTEEGYRAAADGILEELAAQ